MTDTHVRTAAIMGLPWSIRVRGMVDSADLDEAAASVWAELELYDRRFSPFRPDSEVCRLRRYPNTARSAELDEVLELAEIALRATGGDFDIRGGGHLDPSGIVKGWAAARAARALDNLRVDYYFNAGGDLGVRTVTDSARPWRIGIEHPGDATRLITVVEIVNGAVATSGSAHRGTHLWDPRTGEASRSVWQATVVGPDLVWADVLATAAAVAGPDRLDRSGWPQGYEVMFASPDGTVRATDGMQLAVS